MGRRFIAWYNILLFVGMALGFPLIIPSLFISEKRRKTVFLRLGLTSTPNVMGQNTKPPAHKPMWIHALSVGEVLSAIPLVKDLGLEIPGKDIVFTATTAKGMVIAGDELGDKVKAIRTMPVDSWWCIRRIFNHIKPSLIILVEADIWPSLIYHLRRRGVKTILVNGRISPRTFRSYRRFPYVARILFDQLDSCLVQSDLDREIEELRKRE